MSTPLDNRSPSPENSTEVWIWTDGQVGGPFPLSDVRELVASGEAPPGLLARIDGGEWLPWPDLYRSLAPLTPPSPVPDATAEGCETKPQTAIAMAPSLSVIGAVFAAVFAVVVVIAAMSNYTGRSDGSGISAASAYRAAVEILRAETAAVQSVSSRDESEIESHGFQWTVRLVVDGRNAFGGPVRRSVTVRMHSDGDRFYRESVVQGPAPKRWSVPAR